MMRVLALVAIFALLLPIGINDDNGYWQLMSYNLLHFGKWPYLQSWDHSFPGPLLIHVPVMTLFGSSDLAFRIADICLELLFCWLLYRLWKLWFNDRTAWLSVLIYALYYLRSGPYVAGEKDGFATIFVFASTYLLLKSERTGERSSQLAWNARLIVASLLIGCAALIKPMYGLFLIPLIVFLPELRTWKTFAILSFFSISPYLCSLLLAAMRPGGLSAYWNATILFNKDVYVTIARPFSTFLKWTISPKVYGIPLAAGLVALCAKRPFRFQRAPSRAISRLYVSFIVLALFSILIQRKYYSYHFVMLVVLLTPVAAHGMETAAQWGGRIVQRRVAWAAIISFLCVISLPYEVLTRQFRQRTPSEPLSNVLESSITALAFEDSSDALTLDYFAKPARQNATIEVASFDPRLRLHLQRPILSRYPTLEALGYRINPKDPYSFTDYQRRWRSAYMDSLTQGRAEYLVISRAPESEYLKDPYADVLHYLPGFDSLLRVKYQLDTIIGTYDIFRLTS